MRLRYHAPDNTLRLTRDDASTPPGEVVDLPGYVDVGEGGRLVGVELLADAGLDLATALAPWLADPVAGEWVSLDKDAAYITLSAPEEAIDQEQVLTTAATLRVELDESRHLRELAIPRRGTGYEISYPSGNR